MAWSIAGYLYFPILMSESFFMTTPTCRERLNQIPRAKAASGLQQPLNRPPQVCHTEGVTRSWPNPSLNGEAAEKVFSRSSWQRGDLQPLHTPPGTGESYVPSSTGLVCSQFFRGVAACSVSELLGWAPPYHLPSGTGKKPLLRMWGWKFEG